MAAALCCAQRKSHRLWGIVGKDCGQCLDFAAKRKRWAEGGGEGGTAALRPNLGTVTLKGSVLVYVNTHNLTRPLKKGLSRNAGFRKMIPPLAATAPPKVERQSRGTGMAEATPHKLQRPVDRARDHVRGGSARNAVQVVVYTDYLCPYCRRLRHHHRPAQARGGRAPRLCRAPVPQRARPSRRRVRRPRRRGGGAPGQVLGDARRAVRGRAAAEARHGARHRQAAGTGHGAVRARPRRPRRAGARRRGPGGRQAQRRHRHAVLLRRRAAL